MTNFRLTIVTTAILFPVMVFAQFAAEKSIVSSGVTGMRNFTVADLQADGGKDVLVPIGSGGILLFESDGQGNWDNKGKIASSETYSGLAVTTFDKDGDGDLDILSQEYRTSAKADIGFRLNNGSNQFGAQTYAALGPRGSDFPSTGNFWEIVASGDLNGDGKEDLMYVPYQNWGEVLHWTQNASASGLSWQNDIESDPNRIAMFDVQAYDFDGDDDLDVLVRRHWGGELVLYMNKGNGSLEDYQTVFIAKENKTCSQPGWSWVDYQNPPPSENCPQFKFNYDVVDWDNDGDLDIVVPTDGQGDLGIYVLKNDGGAHFSSPENLLSASDNSDEVVGGIKVSDFDGDGDNDVVAGISGERGLAVYTNENGLLTFSHTLMTGCSFSDTRTCGYKIVVTDADGDWDIDIITHTASSIVWYENTSDVPVIATKPTVFDPVNFQLAQHTNELELTIRESFSHVPHVVLFDMVGQEVGEVSTNAKGHFLIDTRELQSGIYIVSVIADGRRATKRVVLNR